MKQLLNPKNFSVEQFLGVSQVFTKFLLQWIMLKKLNTDLFWIYSEYRTELKRRPTDHPQELIMYSGLCVIKRNKCCTKKYCGFMYFMLSSSFVQKIENYVYCVLFNLLHQTIIFFVGKIISISSWMKFFYIPIIM